MSEKYPDLLTRASPSSRGVDRRRVLTGALAGGVGLALSPFLPDGLGSGNARAATPKPGGNLRVAITGGGATDTLDAHTMNTSPDLSRVMTLYEGLTTLDNDSKLINVLAESFEPNATATEWTIRLRKGVTFHNGKPFKAEDVAFTFRRIGDPKNPLQGATGLKPVDLDNIKIVDDYTLRVPTKAPFATLPETLSAVYYFGIVPVGYDPKTPVGTGPFKYESFTPGQQSVFTRYDGYWQPGLPYLDSVTIIDSFQNDTAAFNALQGGEVDVYAYATLSLASQVTPGSGLKALVSKPGLYVPFYMNTDVAPFNDVNVRKALRLLVDRQQLIDQSLSGHGIIGNDVFGRWDPAFDDSLKRPRDIDQAKFLLNKAGQTNLNVELTAVDLVAGMIQGAQVYAQQAKDAGVTVNVKQLTPDAYYAQYGKWPFTQDYWVYQPYLTVVALATLPTAPYNATHWNHQKYNELYAQAQSIVDPAKRAEIIREMQKIDFEEGGFIIPSFNETIDLMNESVQGFESANTGNALGNFGFVKSWLA
jgi:peptide/nickel transport system substrate-binding protein